MRQLLLVSAMALLVVATRPVGAQTEAKYPETSDGAVLIYGDAASATVMIDGNRRGQMPVSAATGFRAELPAGQHVIELRREANNRFYEFGAHVTVEVKEDSLVPVTMPALAPTPLADAAPRVDAVVAAFLAGMATIPAGSFMMGGRDQEDSADTEFPRHQVTFAHPFLMQKQNVTFEQWDACVADGGCTHVPDDEGHGRGDRQVFNVSWQDARGFAKWLSRRLDRDCHLPSEAEWEYAVRGGTQTTFFVGDDESLLYDYVGTGGSHPTAVRPRLPNPYGLFGMVGGVSQWVADCWQTTYRGAPDDGSPWEEGDCKSRGVRGGFWDGGPWYLRSARRSAMTPRNRYNYVGLRLACAMP